MLQVQLKPYMPTQQRSSPDANVTQLKIADANVTTAKIANAAVTNAKLDVRVIPLRVLPQQQQKCTLKHHLN
jgi:hypothetical protein